MSQQTSFTTTRRPNRGRFRLLAGLVLSAGLLLSAAACGDKGDDTGSGDDPAADAKSAITSLKVCELVDLEPLMAKIGTEYAEGPKDIGIGIGTDAAGQQCYAQIVLPKVQSGPNSTPIAQPNALLNISVAPYSSAETAAAEYERRLTETKGIAQEDQKLTDLSGSWTKGSLTSGYGDGLDIVYALILQDSYLLKFQFTWANAENYTKGYPFTRAELATVAQDLMTPFYTAVTAKVGG